jgi:hypothetical protein
VNIGSYSNKSAVPSNDITVQKGSFHMRSATEALRVFQGKGADLVCMENRGLLTSAVIKGFFLFNLREFYILC